MSTIPAPHKVVTAGKEGVGQRTSFWVIAIVPFAQPAAMYSPQKINPTDTRELQIVEDDAISVTISQSKDNFGDMCNISLKSTNVYYPALVHPGDWIFVWMFDNQVAANKCVERLSDIRDGSGNVGYSLVDYKSGLKHVGRVTSTGTQDAVSNSARTITQSIQSQSFLEFATSVYYIYDIPASVASLNTPSNTGFLATDKDSIISFQRNGLDRALTGLADKFLEFYDTVNDQSLLTPDRIIALFFILIMGIDSSSENNKFSFDGVTEVRGTLNDGIAIPKLVAKIMGEPTATKLWQLYRLNLGVEKFANGKEWYKSFAPLSNGEGIDRMSPMRCKGVVPFTPVMWSNVSMWSILSTYLNPVCNEMYTAFRLDKNGILKPTLTVREKPFTTGLIYKINEDGSMDSSLEAKPSTVSTIKTNPLSAATTQTDIEELKASITIGDSGVGGIKGGIGSGITETTPYATVPRWVIDPSMVLDFSWATDEASRVNFVQVKGAVAQPGFVNDPGAMDNNDLQQSQLIAGNYVSDEADIARNGLRAVVLETPYDSLSSSTTAGSLSPIWARLNADWLFNGHMKAKGSITLMGVFDPITVGDNLQYAGILFHIEAISHTGSISNGQKQWRTSITLSNGILASSMSSEKSLPLYASNIAEMRYRGNVVGPGYTAVQERVSGSNNLSLQDAIKRKTKR